MVTKWLPSDRGGISGRSINNSALDTQLIQPFGSQELSLMNSHGGMFDDKKFSDYFEIQILKAYKKPFTMLVEEGTYISSHKGELLNSKSEWHQAKIIRTTTQVIQGGADLLRQQQGGRRVGL